MNKMDSSICQHDITMNTTELLESRMMQLEYSFNNLIQENAMKNHEIRELKDKLEETTISLEKEMQNFQQYIRRESIEITGLPDHIEQFDLENVVVSILERIGIYVDPDLEIAACHRLKKRRGEKFARVIIRFVNRKRAYQCLFNRKFLRDAIREYPNLYIHESLCFRCKDIYDKCDDLKNCGKLKKLWTFNGIVHFKLTDNYYERPKKVFHIKDLNKFFTDLPAEDTFRFY